MKFKLTLFLLAIVAGAGLWWWGQHTTVVSRQIKGARTDTRISKPTELGLVWQTTGVTGGRVVTTGATNQPRILTPESEDVKLTCRINDTQLAYFVKDDNYYKLWLWAVDQSENKYIVATRLQPTDLICDQLGNRILYLVLDGNRRVLYQVDLATSINRSIDSVIGRPALDQTGQRLIYPTAEGLYYREIDRSGELSEPIRVVESEVVAAVFTQSNTAAIYVGKEKDNYVLYRTDWRDQTTERIHSFEIGQNDLEWSLDISNDGETILYRYAPIGSVWQSTLGTIRMDGTKQQILLTDIGRAAWEPNDSSIVYEKRRFDSDTVSVDLWRMSAQGSEREVIAGSGRNNLPGYQVVDPNNGRPGQ